MSEWNGKRIAVIGLAATGLATAKVLRDAGAMVTVYDGKPEEKLDAGRVAEVRNMDGVTFKPAHDSADWTGTDLVVPSPGVPRYAKVLEEAVARNVPIYSEIEVAYRFAKAPILAITGTNGKTTTTALVGAICREAGLATWVAGNIAEDAGKRTPLIEAAIEAPADGVIVAEISSFQLEWVTTFRPKVAAWLNLSPDHLDRHKDMDEYARAKSNIFRAQTEEDFAVLNADDEMVMKYSEGVGKARRKQFTLGKVITRAEIEVTDAYVSLWHVDYIRYIPGARHSYFGLEIGNLFDYENHCHIDEDDILISGWHNWANILAAGLMAQSIGIGKEAINKAVKGFRGVAHRMEFVAEINGVRYINNSMCTNPAAVVASADAAPKPLIAIAGGIHKGGDLTKMAEALAKNARHIVLIGVSAPEIEDALRRAGATSIEQAGTLPQAVERAAAFASPGDTVMLIPGCASFDMFSGFEERGQVFRDAVKGL